jgi:hypothetical protein
MKRSVVVFVLLVACGSKAPNPWAVKKWDTASLVAWVDACAETTGAKTYEGNGRLSVTSPNENQIKRPNMSDCSMMFDQRRERLIGLSVSVSNWRAQNEPNSYRLEYSKQLALVVELVPAKVRATVRSVASGPRRGVIEHPFYISGGFTSPGVWHLNISLVKGY